ncbi:heavy metal translocating P-type ATPase [Paenibacillus dendritiformis]|uniref:heavy metal translocating P-type ATPase n=1 Tax=Paenibacillus dendritiformis TaxID=130049 RepID=UPI00248ABBBC|nr:heavy metal translocating P-type ATPase [Paenibacillus dendritiformis]WGU94278.1 heavy metal translocating P-type ATPase [Paenibacillus dendritiformis]
MNRKQSFTEWMDKYGEALAAAGSACFIALAFIAGYVSETLAIVFFALSYVMGGWLKLKDGLVTLIRDKDLDVNLLMIAAALGAASIGYWSEGAILIFIFALSGALETFTMNRSSRDISALMDLKPEQAIVFRDGQEVIVPVEQLQVGETVLVKPGERIPADGLVQEGSSAVDQASITGESVPVDKGPGDEVFAGTVNGQGALYMEVTQSSESSLFSKIIRLVQEAQSEMPKSQRFIEKFERIYARVIILVTLLLIFIPPLLLGETWEAAFYRSMVFLVVASPCALVASIMPATLSAISNSARKGLLFKGGAYLDHISRVQVIAFDKTGTLTQGRLTVTDLDPRGGLQASELLQAAAALESLSTHPIAKAIVLEAERDRGTGSEAIWARPTDFQARSGLGIEAEMEGGRWRIGKPSFILNETEEEVLARTTELQSEGKTVIAVERDGVVVGLIALQDRIRPETPAIVRQLKQNGIQVAMLTGDQERTAQAIAAEAGIELVFAELMPEDKLTIVKKLKSEYGAIAMVGDGVNDAPALAAANVGIAMGAAGSDAALETADLVLMNDDLGNIEHAISLGRRTQTIVKQNIIFAGAVIVALISANFLFGIPLPLGVVGHEGSTILVILNGLRLLRS